MTSALMSGVGCRDRLEKWPIIPTQTSPDVSGSAYSAILSMLSVPNSTKCCGMMARLENIILTPSKKRDLLLRCLPMFAPLVYRTTLTCLLKDSNRLTKSKNKSARSSETKRWRSIFLGRARNPMTMIHRKVRKEARGATRRAATPKVRCRGSFKQKCP